MRASTTCARLQHRRKPRAPQTQVPPTPRGLTWRAGASLLQVHVRLSVVRTGTATVSTGTRGLYLATSLPVLPPRVKTTIKLACTWTHTNTTRHTTMQVLEYNTHYRGILGANADGRSVLSMLLCSSIMKENYHQVRQLQSCQGSHPGCLLLPCATVCVDQARLDTVLCCANPKTNGAPSSPCVLCALHCWPGSPVETWGGPPA